MTLLAVTLPAVALGVTWWLITAHRDRLGLGRLSTGGTLVVAFVAFEAGLVLLTEGLSAGRHLTTTAVTVAWAVVVLALAVALVVTVGRHRLGQQVRNWRPSAVAARVRERPRGVVLAVAAVVVIVVVLGVISVLYLPNNTDSLVYHLARIPHWEQEASVEHFATHYTAQIELSPLHEFNVLHVHLLSGTDRLDALVQLFAFVVCIVGAAELARLLGAALEVQLGAALICASIPSAVLQASSTQNDIFAAAVGLGLFVLLLGWVPLGRWLAPAILLGAAVGVAAIVKGVLPPLIAPALVLLAGRQILVEWQRSSGPRAIGRAAAVLAVALVVGAVVAGPFLKRNQDLFGSLTGPVSDSTVNELFSERAAVGNVIRATAVNFRVGDGRSGLDTMVQDVALGGLGALYDVVGASQQDQRFVIGALDDAFQDADYVEISRFEEYGANPWHVLLIVVTGGLFLYWVIRGDRDARLPLLLCVGLAVGFVAFFANARWSLFVSRYQLPLFVVWAPLIAIALGRLHRWVLRVVVAFLVVAVAPQLLDNATRSLLDADLDFPSDLHGYFVHAGGDGFFVAPEDYVAARDAIVASGCDRLGIENWILLEYPIWAGLEHAGWEGTIEHVDVDNPSAELEDEAFEPCALIRQAVGRPAWTPPDGWEELQFQGLTVALAPESDRASG